MRIGLVLAFILSLAGCATVDHPLYRSIDEGNFAELERMTRETPATVNQLDVYGSGTPLERVFYTEKSAMSPSIPDDFREKAVKLLLERGASTKRVSKRVGVWFSATEVAASSTNIEVLELLLDYGIRFDNDQALHKALARPSHYDRRGDRLSAREQTQYNDLLRTVALLLDHGWPTEQRRAPNNYFYDINHFTPLMVAAYLDHGPVVELLLSRGADPSVAVNGLNPAALAAIHNPNVATLDLLLLHHPESLNARFLDEGESLLHLTARSNENSNTSEIIQALLSHGADPNALTTRGSYSPMAAAAMSANAEAAMALLDGGADLNGRDRMGRTPLDILVTNSGAWTSQEEAFQGLLLQAGGEFALETPRRRLSEPRVAQPENDNFGTALIGGLTAAAIAFDQGVSEAAAVDFGTSMAQDINQGTVTQDSFDARRFENAYQRSQPKALGSTNAPTENNLRQVSGSETSDNQNKVVKSKGKVYEPGPISSTKKNTVWHATREYARDYARLAAAHDVVRQCRANGARADGPTYQMIQQEVVPPRWDYASPDCKQGGWEGKEWVCQATVSGTCYRVQ